MRTFEADSQGGGGQSGSRLLRVLVGGEQNTVIGRRREAQQEDTFAKVPVVLQKVLNEELSRFHRIDIHA